ncbi:hypothetical protein [Roseateles sp.]|uniref:hypothetical protein n=1 Tax=Roseateles sp. TaxID=1971397 RepID=UPI0031D611F1
MSNSTRRKQAKRRPAPIFTTAQIAEIETRALRDLAAIEAVTAALQRSKPLRRPLTSQPA